MVNTKVKTVIVNRSHQELILRVGNNCFAKLATIADGSEHNLEIDIHWTYQEFSLEPAAMATAGHGHGHELVKKMIFTSDDCCDFELMEVTISEEKLQLEKFVRGQLKIKDDVVDVDPRLPATPEVLVKRGSFFTSWLPTWPKFGSEIKVQ